MPKWWVYMVRCRDRSLYTGIALDLERRIAEHEKGDRRGAKYLRGRGPLELVLAKAVGAKPVALRVERRVKRLRKAEKETLIGRKVTARQLIALAGTRPRSRRR
jgi:putative endonuclease